MANVDFGEHSIIGWVLKNQIKTENGKPYDLRSHPYMFDILRDWSPLQVWLKSAQVGGSIAANLKLLWAVHHYGLNAAYTLPTAGDVKEFVGGKTNMLISQNPVLSQWIQDKDSVEQKRIGNNTIYFRGTMTERAALSFSSDLNVYDEEDRSDQNIIAQYASRLQHSDYKWEWHFSNPSVEGNGVHKHWSVSDKKHWFIRCSRCSKQQFLSWPESVDIEGARFVCKHCHGELSEDDRRQGNWIAEVSNTKPKFAGYWISQMMVPKVKALEIIDLYKSKSLEYFYNFVLGLPFVGSGSKLSEQALFANLTERISKQQDPIVIGVDTGLPMWLVIGNKDGIFHWESFESYSRLEQLLRLYPKSIIVSDQGGDLIGIRELQEKYPGRVYLAYYRADRKTLSIIDWGKAGETGKVVIDRNRMIQMIVDEFTSKRIPIHGSREDWQLYWVHWSNIFRSVTQDALGVERYVWERNGPDHLVHATVYWRAGMDKFGMGEGQVVEPHGSLLDNIPNAIEIGYDGKAIGHLPEPPEPEWDWRHV